ncbi:MAG: hypothetical protein AB1446_09910 [Bacillota bacterium]
MNKLVAGVAVVVLALAALWLAGCRGGAEVGSGERLPGVVWPLWPPGFAGVAERLRLVPPLPPLRACPVSVILCMSVMYRPSADIGLRAGRHCA